MPCPDVFVQDVPGFLRRKGLTFVCYFDPSRPAVVDDAHAARINYETYLFATAADRDLFLTDVVAYCGLLTDPVTKQRFRPPASSSRTEHEGVTYVFETSRSQRAFVRRPEDYLLPGYTM